jgi:hypothetical protein
MASNFHISLIICLWNRRIEDMDQNLGEEIIYYKNWDLLKGRCAVIPGQQVLIQWR